MKIIKYLLFSLLLAGCAKSFTGSQPKTVLMVLDNHGGYAHAGRKIALQSDGTYTDSKYTDVIGDEKATSGSYTFNDAKTVLTLWSSTHQAEQLYRVDVSGQQYWVHADEKRKILNANETSLQQNSLRLDVR